MKPSIFIIYSYGYGFKSLILAPPYSKQLANNNNSLYFMLLSFNCFSSDYFCNKKITKI